MQSIGKSLKSAYKICDPLGEDPTYTELADLMIKVNFGKPEKADRATSQHNYIKHTQHCFMTREKKLTMCWK